MKVAVVTKYFPTPTHPWAGHSAFQTLRLLTQFCDVHAFRLMAKYPPGLAPEDPFGRPGDGAWRQTEVPVTYVDYPVFPVISRPLNGYIMANRLLAPVRAYQPDIILDYIAYPDGFAAVRIGKKLGVPVVLTPIGSDLNRIPDRFCEKLTRAALRDADFVTTVSADLAKTAIKLGANPATTQPILNGCDTTIFHPAARAAARVTLGLDPTEDIVLYVGRLDVRKGLVELIEAAAVLQQHRPNLRCYLIGDGPDRPRIHEAIAAANAAAFVIIKPPVDTAAIATWMAASNLVTLPSYNEGCPNVVVEALAAGRPVVATRVGGIPELVDDTCGRLVPVREVSPLTEALDQVLTQPWDAQTIATQHGRSWAEVAIDLYAVLQRTTANYGR